MNKGGDHSGSFTPLTKRKSRRIFGSRRQSAAGFTIVETLIVLAVTGTLFASAATLINGRQAKTQFQTGINAAKQQMQQVINESASGFFPGGGFNCTGSIGGQPSFTIGANAQGTNSGCTFVGKAVQLAPQGASATYVVYPLVGNRREVSGDNVTSIYSGPGGAGAWPVALNQVGSKTFSQQITFEDGLTVYQPLTTAAAFGFISTFGGYTDSGGSSCNGLCSGSQQSQLYAVPLTSVSLNEAPASAAPAMSGNGKFVLVAPDSKVDICLTDGTRSGLLTITPQLTVDLSVRSNARCA
jgi:type II secretory pathway pseudopilin PulG